MPGQRAFVATTLHHVSSSWDPPALSGGNGNSVSIKCAYEKHPADHLNCPSGNRCCRLFRSQSLCPFPSVPHSCSGPAPAPLGGLTRQIGALLLHTEACQRLLSLFPSRTNGLERHRVTAELPSERDPQTCRHWIAFTCEPVSNCAQRHPSDIRAPRLSHSFSQRREAALRRPTRLCREPLWADKVGKTAPHDSPCTAQGVTPLLAGCEEGR